MLKPIVPYIEYAVNYDYISKVLCINKDKPEVLCNGKCHLSKKLEQQKEETPTPLQIHMEEYPIGFVNILSIDKLAYILIEKDIYSSYIKNYNFLFNKAIFHPPTT